MGRQKGDMEARSWKSEHKNQRIEDMEQAMLGIFGKVIKFDTLQALQEFAATEIKMYIIYRSWVIAQEIRD